MDKLKWSKILKNEDGTHKKMNHEKATKYAKSIGGRLPKAWEMLKAFEEKEFDFEEEWFWSSSPHGGGYSFYFNGFNGLVYYNPPSYEGSVLCVLSPEANLNIGDHKNHTIITNSCNGQVFKVCKQSKV